jgi:hypothetical protein
MEVAQRGDTLTALSRFTFHDLRQAHHYYEFPG